MPHLFRNIDHRVIFTCKLLRKKNLVQLFHDNEIYVFFFKKRTNSIKACHSADGQMLSMPFNCEVCLTEKGANNCLVAVKDFILFFLSPSGKLPETLLFLPHHCSEIEGFQIRCHGTHGANILLTIYNQKCLLTLQLSRMRGSLMVSPGQGSHTG